MKLSIVIPVYNERQFIGEILKRVQNVDIGIEKEIIIVDDFSTDGTREFLKELVKVKGDSNLFTLKSSDLKQKIPIDNIKVFFQNKNYGKGATLRYGFKKVSGDIIIIQDADLEYDPADYLKLLKPILDGRAEVVYGNRFHGGSHRVLYFWHYVGNKFLTLLSNMLTNINFTDMEVGYKVFKTDVIKKIRIKSNRFGFEPEITVKVAKMGCRIYEVPISYNGRTYKEGKKINWKDGLAAIYYLLRFRLFD